MLTEFEGKMVRVQFRRDTCALTSLVGTLLRWWVTSTGDTLAIQVDSKLIPWAMVAWIETAA